MDSKNYLNSTNLYLPIFLASRNRIKLNHFSKVLNYISKNVKNYVRCYEDNEDVENCGEIEDFDKENKNNLDSPSFKTKRRNVTEKSWQLAPNRYTIQNEFHRKKQGIQWSKGIPRVKKNSNVKYQNQTIFYEISKNFFEKSKKQCNRHKGKFLTDPRNRQPTTRFMISNPVLCSRNQKDPGPTKYFIGIFEKTTLPRNCKKNVAPYKFLRYSCVPENTRLQLLGNSSFAPGPGRYELLDDELSLRTRLTIEIQKRFHYRRLNYQKLNISHQYPNSHIRRHIFGFGFTRLFRSSIIRSKKLISKKKTHRTSHDVRMFPSFEYIKMITNPDRNLLSKRTEDSIKSPNVLRFNCLVKISTRRQLRDNKKVVFGSGVPRFKDLETPLLHNQLKPPPLVNFPIMSIDPRKVRTKLHGLPERLRGIYKRNRVQPFKFQPIPSVKLLLDENEVHPDSEENLEVYAKELNPNHFIKEQYKSILFRKNI